MVYKSNKEAEEEVRLLKSINRDRSKRERTKAWVRMFVLSAILILLVAALYFFLYRRQTTGP